MASAGEVTQQIFGLQRLVQSLQERLGRAEAHLQQPGGAQPGGPAGQRQQPFQARQLNSKYLWQNECTDGTSWMDKVDDVLLYLGSIDRQLVTGLTYAAYSNTKINDAVTPDHLRAKAILG